MIKRNSNAKWWEGGVYREFYGKNLITKPTNPSVPFSFVAFTRLNAFECQGINLRT